MAAAEQFLPEPRVRWNLLTAGEAPAAEIAKTFGLHPVVARILAARGWNAPDKSLPPFLQPMLRELRSPFELQQMDAAVERTLRAIRNGERICVYGDYDVDGVTSTALLVEALRFLGVEPQIVIPHRLNDGYGMNTARIDEIARAGCTLILTVDNGVSAVEQVRHAARLGVDVVVTDHHLAGEELPAALALVNPNCGEEIYEHGRLCGVGVAFKFSHALLKKAGTPEQTAKKFLMGQMDLVALGTVADMVPLSGENRIFVRHGLPAILNTLRPGLRALLEVSGYRPRRMTPDFVAFGMAPRLNAAGRTDDPMLALRLLLTQDKKEGASLAKELDRLNRERRTIEADILGESSEAAEASLARGLAHTLVVGGEGWHLGVVGIVASRLTELYNVPAIVLALEDNHARGSARSVPGFDIHGALTACDEHLVTYGGHAMAAGLKLQTSSLEEFREAINEHAREILAGMDRTEVLDVDAEVSAQDINWKLYNDLQSLQPFGEGNPAPLFLLRGVRCAQPPRIVGKNHLKLRLAAGGRYFDAIGFSRANLLSYFENGAVDIIFRPMENNFNGTVRLELELQDARPAAT